jgi:hypothetical protein
MASATELGWEAELELAGFGGLFRARKRISFFPSLLCFLLPFEAVLVLSLCALLVGFGEEIGGGGGWCWPHGGRRRWWWGLYCSVKLRPSLDPENFAKE